MKKSIALLASAAFLVLPFAAIAQTATLPPPSNAIIPGGQSSAPASAQTGASDGDVLSQLQALQQRIAQLEAQYGGSAPAGASQTAGFACGAIVPTLGPGASGAGVSQLQTFLASNPAWYPQGLITGYYGSLTTAAVQAFQSAQGIVSSGSPSTTGYGQVGPRTAAAIQAQCGSGGSGASGPQATVVGGFIQVSPDSGNAPLQVNIAATVNTTNSCGAATYTIDFGDGSQPASIAVPAGTCQSAAQSYTHTYSSHGTYNITLASGIHQSVASVVVQ